MTFDKTQLDKGFVANGPRWKFEPLDAKELLALAQIDAQGFCLEMCR